VNRRGDCPPGCPNLPACASHADRPGATEWALSGKTVGPLDKDARKAILRLLGEIRAAVEAVETMIEEAE